MIPAEILGDIVNLSLGYINQHILVISTVIQLSIIFTIYILASLLAQKPNKHLSSYIKKSLDKETLDKFSEEAIISLVMPTIWLIFQWLSFIVLTKLEFENGIIEVVAKLLTAWIIIRLSSSLVRSAHWSKYIAVFAWSIAALSITGLLDPTIALLDSFAIEVGKVRLSILSIMTGIITLAFLLWVSGFASNIIEKKIDNLPNLTPSIKVLLSKSSKIVLITLAIFVGLNSLGIDLTALTVFGGAIGLGIGFGLQKVISNLFSGIILLLDRSVKPGDVIEVGDTYGWVNSLSARYVSVLTRDGVEHLIPNEHLITEKVTNWSYSDRNIRIKVPIGISYDDDVNKALEIMESIADRNDRVLKEPEPYARLIEFGDSSINLELRAWINDPIDGVANVKSDLLLAFWNEFKKNNIQIPFPQRDINFKVTKEIEKLFKK